MITYCRNKENSFPSETKQEYQLSSMIQQNLPSPSNREDQTTPGNQAHDSIPKICAIFSLKNETKTKEEKDKEKEEAIQIGGGIFEEVAQGEDEESIEEFDPEDPAFLEDEEEEEEEEEESAKSPATVYKYDIAAKSYVRLEKSEEGVSVKSGTSQTSEGEGESQKEGMRQPNILKRKLPTTKNEGEDEIQSIVKERKMQKLDTNNLSNVKTPAEEDGIMYVTVKGSKPNEILLVKVSERASE